MSYCDDNGMEDKYFVADLQNDEGVVGCIGLSREDYDEEEFVEFTYMLIRTINAWHKRREFEHQFPELYHSIC